MAGAGFKTFTTGEVLTAANVNEYLMQQTVMVFASAAARTTALGANVAEGMMSYLKDTNAVEVYDGSSWVASDDPNAIQNSIVDAKGDLISATAADTPARLASSGVNGDVLTVDTSTATGLKWAAASGGGDNWTIVNSGGTALTGAATVTVSGISNASKLFIYIDGASSVNAQSYINLRLNTDTGANYNQYGVQISRFSSFTGSVLNTAQGSGNASYRLGRMADNDTSAVQAYALITGCSSTGIKVIQSSGTGNADNSEQVAYIAGGFYNSSSTISSVSIFSTSGNLDAGTVYVYKA